MPETLAPERLVEICVDFFQPQQPRDRNEIYRFVGQYAAALNDVYIDYSRYRLQLLDGTVNNSSELYGKGELKWFYQLSGNARVGRRLISYNFGTLELSPDQLLLFSILGITFLNESGVILIMYENVEDHPYKYFWSESRFFGSHLRIYVDNRTRKISSVLSIVETLLQLRDIYPPEKIAAVRRDYELAKEQNAIAELHDELIPYGESNNLTHLTLEQILEDGELQRRRGW